jgi:hypothetical protein
MEIMAEKCRGTTPIGENRNERCNKLPMVETRQIKESVRFRWLAGMLTPVYSVIESTAKMIQSSQVWDGVSWETTHFSSAS